MNVVLCVCAFALAYTLKGGQFPWVNGRALALVVVGVVVAYLTRDPYLVPAAMVAWVVGVYPSMGEEAGAVGRWGYWWGKYKDLGFTRSYGVKKALQRGAWMGAAFTLVTGSMVFIPVLTAGFALSHFLGQELYFRIHGKDDWKYSEVAIGALIGLCFYIGA